MSSSLRLVVVAACALSGVLAGCSGDGGGGGGLPIVERIPEAVAAVEEHYGAPQEYFEISAGLESVTFVVAVADGTAAEAGAWEPDGGLAVPEPVGEATGATFTADRIDVDPDRIFTQLRDELDDPAIIDLAVTGGPDGAVLYDATVASSSGGVILVLLGPNGEIRGVQGQ